MLATPFLMFQGQAQAAMALYASVFPDAEILEIQHYPRPGATGTVMRAKMRLAGLEVYCLDSPVRHEFDFTPSFSFFIECQGEDELEVVFTALGADGQVLMPPDNYGFSQKFAWLNDKFGVSWQLNLP